MSSFSQGFKNGVSIRNVPVHTMLPGKVVWVNNSNVLPEKGVKGSDSNDGTYLRPFATIEKAISRCVADRGDIIAVMPGHDETITSAAAIDLDVAGVQLLGLGHGNKMATIRHNHASATVAVGADNVVIENMRFLADITSVAVGINVEDGVDHCVIRGCHFGVVAAGTDEYSDVIKFNDASNNAIVEDCVIDMDIAAAVSAIAFVKDSDKSIVRNNVIRGDYSTANIRGATTLSTNLLIKDNILENGVGGNLNAQPVIELLTGSTGTIANNYCVCNLATKAAAIVADTCLLFQNYYNEDISSAATGGIIGAASADD